MFEVKPCPFCSGRIKLVSIMDSYDLVRTEVRCELCKMNFVYEQNFASSKDARVARDASFEELWNSRV